jgi:hypothetical protein
MTRAALVLALLLAGCGPSWRGVTVIAVDSGATYRLSEDSLLTVPEKFRIPPSSVVAVVEHDVRSDILRYSTWCDDEDGDGAYDCSAGKWVRWRPWGGGINVMGVDCFHTKTRGDTTFFSVEPCRSGPPPKKLSWVRIFARRFGQMPAMKEVTR